MKKLNIINKWRINIIKFEIKLKEYINNIYNSSFLRLYDHYKYKETYLETLRIIYQIKESENYSFHPKTNKEYNSKYYSKYLTENSNNLTKYSSKNKLHSSKHSSYDKKMREKPKTYNKINNYNSKPINSAFNTHKYESKIKKKSYKNINISKSINSLNVLSNDDRNSYYKRNSFNNNIYLSKLIFSEEQSLKISKISLLSPNKKSKKKTRNKINKKNNLLYPSQSNKKYNHSENEKQIKSKTNLKYNSQRISHTISISKSFMSDNSIIKNQIRNKNKNNQSIKLSNINYFLKEKNNDNKKNFSAKLNYYNLYDSNDNSLTVKNSKELKTAENSKLKSPSESNNFSNVKKTIKKQTLTLNLEDPLYEINSNDNYYSTNSKNEKKDKNKKNNLCIVSNDYLNVKGNKQESNSISLQSISDGKLFNQAKLYLTTDNSLENFIRLNKKKIIKKVINK